MFAENTRWGRTFDFAHSDSTVGSRFDLVVLLNWVFALDRDTADASPKTPGESKHF